MQNLMSFVHPATITFVGKASHTAPRSSGFSLGIYR
jgi:hypothetical protein